MKTTGVVPEAFAASISLLSRSEMDAMPTPLGRSGRSSDPSEPTTSSSTSWVGVHEFQARLPSALSGIA